MDSKKKKKKQPQQAKKKKEQHSDGDDDDEGKEKDGRAIAGRTRDQDTLLLEEESLNRKNAVEI